MSIDRRHFIQGAMGAAAVSMVWSSRASAASNIADVRVAQIGFKSRGSGHINDMPKNIVALCDVDQHVLDRKADELKERHGSNVDKYTDFRKLLENDAIDAVSIATPNHTHALITIAAIQAGKDVYVEKPTCHNVWEGRQMVAAARQGNRIVQCGTQSRSSSGLQEAVAYVQGGKLGKIQYAIGTCYKPRKSIGKLEEPLDIPSYIDYDLWCGPAAKEELYRPQLHYDWHWDFNTGAGDMGNQGIHQMDIARWFLGEETVAPRTISIGGRLAYDDAGDTPNTQVVCHAYEKAPLIFETRGLPRSERYQEGGEWDRNMDHFRGSGIGVIVQCEDGYVLVPSYSQAIVYNNAGEVVKKFSGGGGHHKNWLEAVVSRDPTHLNAEIQKGHVSTALCHIGAISHRVGETARADEISEQFRADPLLSGSYERMAGHLRANGVDIDSGEGQLVLGPWLEIDAKTEQITNNDQGQELFKRKGRAPFEIPDIESQGAQAAAAG